MTFHSFEDIRAWQEARILMVLVRRFCKRAIAKKDWSWANQISKSATSIMANIAEGNDASTNTEFVRFLGYAKRSDAEVRSHLYSGLDEGYVTAGEFDEASAHTRRIGAQIAALMHYLSKHLGGRRVKKKKTS